MSTKQKQYCAESETDKMTNTARFTDEQLRAAHVRAFGASWNGDIQTIPASVENVQDLERHLQALADAWRAEYVQCDICKKYVAREDIAQCNTEFYPCTAICEHCYKNKRIRSKAMQAQRYTRPNLPHPHGGLIARTFWRCAPIGSGEAWAKGIFKDTQQELYLIALELQGLRDKELMSAVQRSSYEFWKRYGWRKDKNARGSASWTVKAQELQDDDSIPARAVQAAEETTVQQVAPECAEGKTKMKTANLWHHESGHYYARGSFRISQNANNNKNVEIEFRLTSENGTECRIPDLAEYAGGIWWCLREAFPHSQNWTVPFHTIKIEKFGETGLVWSGGTRYVEKDGVVFEEEERLILNEDERGACACKRKFDERYIFLVRSYFNDQQPPFELRFKTCVELNELETLQVGCSTFYVFPDRCVFDDKRKLFVDKIMSEDDYCTAFYSDKRHENTFVVEIEGDHFETAKKFIIEKNLRVEVVEFETADAVN